MYQNWDGQNVMSKRAKHGMINFPTPYGLSKWVFFRIGECGWFAGSYTRTAICLIVCVFSSEFLKEYTLI